MKYHFTHALVLTPFESSLNPLKWETLVQQDYPIHALYCREVNRLIFHSDNQKNDCMNEISKIKQTLVNLSIPAQFEQQIIILRDDENEYSEQDVLKHFSH